MRFPTYWVCDSYQDHDRAGKLITRHAYGWSAESEADARRVARDRAKRSVDYAINGPQTRPRDEYGYGVDPAREELIDTLELEGAPIAAVTRNRYGALVLNTERVLFVDIDKPKPTGGLFKRLFGKSPSPVEMVMESMRAWHAANPRHALRVYQTAAGFRVAFVESTHEATSPATIALMQSLNADPLYVTLCRRQKCFRARLSPKPWRCDMPTPRALFPYASGEIEQGQRNWENQYVQRAESFATCQLLGTFGPDARDPIVQTTIDLHDSHTLNSGRPLA